jgi:replicative DNA helicase
VSVAVRDLMAANFVIDEQPRLTAEQIVARAKREQMKSPLSLVLVDHLHDMRRPGKDLVNEIADDCRLLKSLAKDLKVPVIVLAQLNRQGDARPVLKDLRASGGIEEVADLVILMHREDYQKQGVEVSPVELIIAKGRNVPTGRTIYLQNRYDVQRLDDLRGYEPPIAEPVRRRSGFDAKARQAGER